MNQWGFYFDQTRCIGCRTCILACKAWNEDKRADAKPDSSIDRPDKNLNAESNEERWIKGIRDENDEREIRRSYMKENWRRVTVTEYGEAPPNIDILILSISCNHCSDPACVEICPVDRLYKEPEYGIVLGKDDEPCIACGQCRDICPWKCPQLLDASQDKHLSDDSTSLPMTKCDLCIDRIKVGLKPACVASCPMRALDAGPVVELKNKYPQWTEKTEDFSKDFVSILQKHTKPNIFFKKKRRRIWFPTA